MVITKLGALSVAKVSAVLYAMAGLVIGGLIALASLAGSAFLGQEQGPALGLFFGVGAVIVLPIFYGALGFVVTWLMALLFNVATGVVGGIEIETDKG